MSKSSFSALAMVLATSVFSASVPVLAEPGGKGPGNSGSDYQWQRDNPRQQGGRPGAARSSMPDDGGRSPDHNRFSYNDARRLAVDHGFTGYRGLPPGVAKNLSRGKPLPPGIARRTVPPEMLRGLPSYPGYEWRIVGKDLVLIAISTAVVTTIINGVFD
ncbi:anti-virulence regulator CigR family protein [Dickeya fangzhongdai]|uniref:anti-virulence regulator CigR family protein n=1 Tax=Dickeya fangzhongdai TaxID=1778540 RepID=UPI00067633FF|nr:anti-virulence regulator CigR family protein [Dickeya fangzhongdai]